MYCDEALDSVEAIAAGEAAADGRLAEHYASCPNCAAALAGARTLEAMLQRRPEPKPPAQFTARTMARVRGARWQSERALDIGFNVAIAAVIVVVVFGVWFLARRSGLSAVGADAFDIMTRGLVSVAQQVGPSLPLYGAATALLATALGLWWWAERDAAL